MLGLVGANAAAEPLFIPPGTPVELMVLTEVSTRNAVAGTPVKLRLNKPVIVDGVTMLPVGTPAFGVVEASKDSSVALQRGTLGVRLTHLDNAGQAIPLDSAVTVKSRGGSADDALKIDHGAAVRVVCAGQFGEAQGRRVADRVDRER